MPSLNSVPLGVFFFKSISSIESTVEGGGGKKQILQILQLFTQFCWWCNLGDLGFTVCKVMLWFGGSCLRGVRGARGVFFCCPNQYGLVRPGICAWFSLLMLQPLHQEHLRRMVWALCRREVLSLLPAPHSWVLLCFPSFVLMTSRHDLVYLGLSHMVLAGLACFEGVEEQI